MKRLLILVPLSCLLFSTAALSQGLKKGSEPIPEWEVYGGQWAKAKGGVRSFASGEAWLQWKGKAEEKIDLQFHVTVRKSTDSGAHHFAISWDADNTGAVRNVAYIGPKGLKVSVYPDSGTGPAATDSHSLFFNKRVPIRAKITKKGIQMLVGREKITASIPSTSLTKLRLYANGMDAIFSKIKVKAK